MQFQPPLFHTHKSQQHSQTMGEKNKKGDEQKKDGESKKKEGNITAVLKTDLHCEGCASKVIRCIRAFNGVEKVDIGDGDKITVVGEVDPVELRDKLEKKTHKKVELISPKPKKDAGNKEKEKNDKNSGGEDKNKDAGKEKSEKKKNNSKEKPAKEKIEEKKPKEKEPPVTTAVFKVNLHCDGCIQKIHKTVTKTKGYQDMKIDKQKELVTVTGAIEMKALAELLQKQLKKEVQIVPQKKESNKKGGGGGDGGEGGDKKTAENSGGDRKEEKSEGNKAQAPVGYPYPLGFIIGDQFHYNPNPYAVQYHAPQMFSDENPNSCSVM